VVGKPIGTANDLPQVVFPFPACTRTVKSDIEIDTGSVGRSASSFGSIGCTSEANLLSASSVRAATSWLPQFRFKDSNLVSQRLDFYSDSRVVSQPFIVLKGLFEASEEPRPRQGAYGLAQRLKELSYKLVKARCTLRSSACF
jgi:hypothetical protein